MKKIKFLVFVALAATAASVSYGDDLTRGDIQVLSNEQQAQTVEINPSFGMIEYFSQQLNLGTGGSKLSVDINYRMPASKTNQGWILGMYGGGGPAPNTQQTAALRLLFPADLGAFLTQYNRYTDIGADLLISGDIMASTLPNKVLNSQSQLLFTPGFFALSLTGFEDLVNNEKTPKNNLQFLSIGARMRFLTTLWDQDQIAPIFDTTASAISSLGSSADYSVWIELGIFNADLKVQYYNFLGGPIGDVAYQGNTDFLKSGALLISFSKALDLNDREADSPHIENSTADKPAKAEKENVQADRENDSSKSVSAPASDNAQ